MVKPIRVLHVFGRLDAGGAESRTMDIYREINREHIQFDFVIHTQDDCFYSNEIKEMGGKIYKFPRFKGYNYKEYCEIWDSFLNNHRYYKIIHGHQTSVAFIYLKIAKKKNIPVRIAHARNSNKDRIIKKITAKLSRLYATDLFAVSKLAAHSEFGKNIADVKIIPNAISAEKFRFNMGNRVKIREKLDIETKTAFIHVGRFHPQKNHHMLLNIFKELLQKNSEIMLFLVGEGPLENEMKEKVKFLNLNDNVVFLGIRDDVPELLQGMDALIFPSLFEGFPGVVLEAQAAGLSCFISNTITNEVELTQLIKFLSIKATPESWANHIYREKIVTHAREKYCDIVTQRGFDIKKVSMFYSEIYENGYLKGK
ncbi:Glycosyltransferase involved in cell wall bisynthesis [Amphibacillus marinus]|uniref:Glycosyltransferase involved in cell wall bisynthesis n=1 Tax=Amphibacillus marinus TaxID=872970 RepID=A0A1H8N6T2_9BACI|nr:glycosyltransferase family 1 protein [Amphibacillus marinus]SEO25256.1 Glycosyltransferase involved in cell wall bisynthesis [Amphibacillus marinus]